MDKWLARVFFPSRVPEFERNEDTLSYLHNLSVISTQRTREKQALLVAQESAIEVYTQHEKNLETKLKTVGLGNDSLDLSTSELLEELVDIGMVVGVDPMNAGVFDIAKGLSDQIDREQDLELRLHEIKSLQTSFEGDLARMKTLKTQLEQAQRNQEARQDTLDEKASEWTRGIKLLHAETEEYNSRSIHVKVCLLIAFLMVGHS